MDITNKNIDGGKAFDWGKTSEDYARYRDIYPQIFYDKLVSRGLCVRGQKVLDLGTGTGVLPRNMYFCGAEWSGADISGNQIEQAKRLAKKSDMKIDFFVSATENIDFPENTFDIITSCQCFWYFDHQTVMPKLAKMLKPNGKLVILYMAWLPFEDRIAGKSEELVLKYSPGWSGAGETVHPINIPEIYNGRFALLDYEEYRLGVRFTKESWHGRMRACRGVGASLNKEELAGWEKEHLELLDNMAPDEFEILHYAALAVLELEN